MKRLLLLLPILFISNYIFSQCSVTVTSSSVTCNSACDATAIAAPVGTGSISYSWMPGNMGTQNVSGLCAGTYTLVMTDSVGCSDTKMFTISEPAALTITLTETPISCNNAKDGKAVASVSGGTPSYTFIWNTFPIEFSSAAINLEPGVYSVTVTDNNGCTITATTGTFVDPPKINVTINITSSVTCYGGNDGAASVSLSGGVPFSHGYNYMWMPLGQTSNSVTGLTALSHTLQFTDSLNCVRDTLVPIPGPAPFIVDATQTNFCGGPNNGIATTTITGGIPGYSYLWLPGSQNTPTASGLLSGTTYTVYVFDAITCLTFDTITINMHPALTGTLNTTNIDCYGNTNGSIVSQINGGVPSYNYLWSPGSEVSADISALSAGGYTLTVTDSASCTLKLTTTITEPAALTLSLSHSSIVCGSGNTAVASTTVTGGTGGYTYLWQPGNYTTPLVSGLPAGSYTCKVTDGNGCSVTNAFNINISTTMTLSLAPTHLLCNGDNSGSITSQLNGGISPFNYSWMPGNHTTANISGLAAGNYTLSVTDSLGCPQTETVTVNQPVPLTLSVSYSNICSSGTGSANALPAGGTLPYTYLWQPMSNTTVTITGLIAGTYTCILTDSNSCSTQEIFTISVSPAISSTIAITNASCFNGSDGTLMVTAIGGTGQLTYMWNNNGSLTTTSISGLSQGSYSVSITDALGCTHTDAANVNSPSAITYSATVNDATTIGGNDGSILITNVSGGTGSGYTYSWNTGSTIASITGLTTGSYTVCVFDNNQCSSCNTYTVGEPGSGISEINGSILQIYPVPFTNNLIISINENTLVSVKIINTQGKVILENKIISGDHILLDTQSLPVGLYFISVESSNRTYKRKVVKTN